MQKIDVSEFRSAVRIISEEFGIEWLKGKVQEVQDGRQPEHPVPIAWADSVELLDKYEKSGQMIKTGRMIWLASFAGYLETVQQLPNYEIAVSKRLANDTEFPKVEYEIFVACLWSNAGHHVEFIPPMQDQRTSEMKVMSDNGELHIECKSRDTYIQPRTADDGDFWRELQFDLVELREDKDIGGDLELLVFIPGERDISAIPKIVSEVRSRLRTGYRGAWTGRQASYLVRELQSGLGEDSEFKLFIPAWQNPAFIAATVGIDDQGRPYPKDPMRIAFFAIDSYKLSIIGNSFDRARRQLPSNALGLIYINLDVSNLDQRWTDLYLEIVAESLATRFSPDLNTRITAIVVTTEPEIVEKTEQGREKVILSRIMKVHRNPYSPLPEGVSIPGEQQ